MTHKKMIEIQKAVRALQKGATAYNCNRISAGLDMVTGRALS